MSLAMRGTPQGRTRLLDTSVGESSAGSTTLAWRNSAQAELATPAASRDTLALPFTRRRLTALRAVSARRRAHASARH